MSDTSSTAGDHHAHSRPPRWRVVLRRNLIAFISLAVALFGLSYNTWRNETTEAQRNTRTAAFRMIEELGEFQQLVDARHYGGDLSESNRINAWGKIVLIRDLSTLLSEPTQTSSQALFEQWQVSAAGLGNADPAIEAPLAERSKALREELLAELAALQ